MSLLLRSRGVDSKRIREVRDHPKVEKETRNVLYLSILVAD